MSETDELLAHRAQQGDEEAARSLFARHAEDLRSRVRGRLPHQLRAKVGESDVVQETCLAAFRHLDDFDPRGDGSFRGWLLRILERKVLDEVRRFADAEKRDVRREVAAGTSVVRLAGPADDPSPSAAAVGSEEQARLAKARALLPDPYREVLRLIHDERLTMVEAGERLGRSAEAARKLHSRAVLALADALGRNGPVAG